MKAFFEREVKRLDFVSERAALREQEKKELDTAKLDMEQVSTANPGHSMQRLCCTVGYIVLSLFRRQRKPRRRRNGGRRRQRR